MNEVLLQAMPALRSDFNLLFILLDVALILIAARLCGSAMQRIGQPRVVGEIIAGVLLGPSLLGPEIFHWGNPFGYLDCKDALALATPPRTGQESISSCLFPPQARPVLGILGQIALVFFMFLVGLELDFDLLKGKYTSIIIVTVAVVAVPMALGFAVGPALYDAKFVGGFGTDAQPSKVAFSLMMGAMMSVTAFPVMARILQEKGLTQSAMGSIGVAAAAGVTVLMFVMVSVATGVARDRSTGDHIIKIASVAAFVAVLFVVVRPLLKPLGRMYEEKGLTTEIFASIIILTFLCAYIAQRLEVTVIVGGFLAGAILPARISLFKDLGSRLADITAVILLPIFLAFSGLQTDFTKLEPKFWAGIALFLVAGIVGKWGAGAVAARIGGLSWAEGNVIGILMNCRGLLILVVALIALNEAKVITPEMQVGGVLMALVTTMKTGPLFDRFLPAATAAAAGPPPEPLTPVTGIKEMPSG